MITFAVISDHSLMMEGIISRLSLIEPPIIVHLMESAQKSVIEELVTTQPEVIIVESKILSNPVIFSLNRLFTELSRVVVIEVSLHSSIIQIIGSNQYEASSVSDLISIFQNVSGYPPADVNSFKAVVC